MHVNHGACEKNYNVTSPWTEKIVKQTVRKSYTALSSSITKSDRTSSLVVSQIINVINKELKGICSLNHDSILRDNFEAVKNFSWETVWIELTDTMPTLMAILTGLVPNAHESKPFLCFLASMLLKKRLPKMGLVQRAVSLLLYGNGTSKQDI